jgi:uncharacterized protein (DUF1778 family)
LEARITAQQKRLFERAASLRGSSVTDFVADSAQQAALEAIKDFRVLKLDRDDSMTVARLLLNPPAPNEALRKAATSYQKLIAASR